MAIPVKLMDLITPYTEAEVWPLVVRLAEDAGFEATSWRKGDIGYTMLKVLVSAVGRRRSALRYIENPSEAVQLAAIELKT